MTLFSACTLRSENAEVFDLLTCHFDSNAVKLWSVTSCEIKIHDTQSPGYEIPHLHIESLSKNAGRGKLIVTFRPFGHQTQSLYVSNQAPVLKWITPLVSRWGQSRRVHPAVHGLTQCTISLFFVLLDLYSYNSYNYKLYIFRILIIYIVFIFKKIFNNSYI